MNLTENVVLYAGLLEVKRLGGMILYEDEYACLLKEITTGLFMIVAHDMKSAKAVMSYLPKDVHLICSHDIYTKQLLEEAFHKQVDFVCWQCAYIKNDKFNIELPDGYYFKKPCENNIPNMIQMYKESMPDLATEEEFRAVLKRGMMAVFNGQELCAFIGIHEEGSIGLLEVAKAHRYKGIACALERYMINMQIEKGAYSYGQIIEGNLASLQLQKKIGMEIAEEKTYWFFL